MAKSGATYILDPMEHPFLSWTLCYTVCVMARVVRFGHRDGPAQFAFSRTETKVSGDGSQSPWAVVLGHPTESGPQS